jgi:hypothetical protein
VSEDDYWATQLQPHVAYQKVTPDQFPMVIEFFRSDTKEMVHRIKLEEPGAVVIPALQREYGVPIDVCVNGVWEWGK